MTTVGLPDNHFRNILFLEEIRENEKKSRISVKKAVSIGKNFNFKSNPMLAIKEPKVIENAKL
ncbi:hypothetical protein [Neobacillus drentensis]|uniref:hypothetical protein n=1 Tax=Neobacillus drentensis TaxID=220684 RepID=UPI002FFD8138